jgi:hypothetical protein
LWVPGGTGSFRIPAEASRNTARLPPPASSSPMLRRGRSRRRRGRSTPCPLQQGLKRSIAPGYQRWRK